PSRSSMNSTLSRWLMLRSGNTSSLTVPPCTIRRPAAAGVPRLAAVPVLRPFRFGVAAHAVASAERWRDLARRAEDVGYATLILPDHLNPQLAPIPGLLAAALQTTSLRVAVQVLDVDHRSPVVAAKEVATLDLLSG